jgi:sec-independent protein translocase protein TatA
MQAVVESITSFASILGGWEIVVILVVVLVLFGTRRWPDIARDLGRLVDGFDRATHDAGESLGGIFGKPAAEAITPDNQVAELYDPAALQGNGARKAGGFWRRLWMRIWGFVARRVRPN